MGSHYKIVDSFNNPVNVAADEMIIITFSEPIHDFSDYSSITVKNSNGDVKPVIFSFSGMF